MLTVIKPCIFVVSKKKNFIMKTKMIGSRISEARKKCNLSQSQLAQQLFISPQAVGKWERGESLPDLSCIIPAQGYTLHPADYHESGHDFLI